MSGRARDPLARGCPGVVRKTICMNRVVLILSTSHLDVSLGLHHLAYKSPKISSLKPRRTRRGDVESGAGGHVVLVAAPQSCTAVNLTGQVINTRK